MHNADRRGSQLGCSLFLAKRPSHTYRINFVYGHVKVRMWVSGASRFFPFIFVVIL